jgi:alpha-tubulin suppressor-like RCC1 family protein
VVGALLLFACPAGCREAPPYRCHDNTSCILDGAQGLCEADGFCSFPSALCSSHQRYGAAAAGNVAGACVPVANDCIVEIAGGGTTEEGLDIGHTCVRRDDGTIWCWGDGSFGQLGAGSSSAGGGGAPPAAFAMQALLPPGARAVSLSSGERHTCAVLQGGALFCWGANNEGQLGVGLAPEGPVLSATPILVGAAPSAKAVGAGGSHTCMTATDGSPFCWGENGNFQVAGAAADPQPTPFKVPGLAMAVDVASGDQHSCGIGQDSSVWCWGSNALGQLGSGDPNPAMVPAPVAVRSLLGAVAVRLGDQHTCALLNDSTLLCWGTNVSGSVGNGAADNAIQPVPVLDGVRSVATSGDGKHTCAVKLDGSLWCWGSNDAGQLGADPLALIKSATPIRVPLVSVKLVGTGAHHTCAVTEDGSLWCWGSNHSGQLGPATDRERSIPVRVPFACPVPA